MEDEGFQRYCTARGVFHVAGERGSRRWLYMGDTRRGRDEFLADPEFLHAQEHRGERYRYTAEMDAGWRVLQLGRAALEDAWELYRGAEPPPQGKRGKARRESRPRGKRKAAMPSKGTTRQRDLF